MTQDEIIEMARQAGYFDDTFGFGIWDSAEFNRFAKLVAQHEREECIKACEQVTADLKNYASAFEGITAETKFVRNIGGIVGEPFVDAIRARGQA
jgi:hypothetical protein